MPRHLMYLIFAITLVALIGLTTSSSSRAESLNRPLAADSPYDLVNAVNVLRTAYGLAPYSINSILMYTAQAQAEFMAATGNVTHSGPGGIGLTDRLLAAGYPLAGELSAGGFRAENITSGNENRTAQFAVDGWAGDALHLNTMISPNLSEIGAGVAVANGRVYYVIDCALPITVGLPQRSTSVPTGETPILVPILSTPNSDGDVIHEVEPGQSLWQLAIAYEVKIEDIKRLNNLFDDNIYPGSKLLIKTDVVLPAASLTAIPTSQPQMTSTGVPVSPTVTLLPTVTIIWSEKPTSAVVKDTSILGIAIGILVLALLGGGVFTWLGSKRNNGA
jgi:uncharacterized protein YkwD/LysM repeat protein